MYAIYRLVDPRDRSTFYVGITDDVYRRYVEHINFSGSNLEKSARIMELRTLNKLVIMETLEELENREDAEDRERYWIRHFVMLGEPLTNILKKSLPGMASLQSEILNLQRKGLSYRDIVNKTGVSYYHVQKIARYGR